MKVLFGIFALIAVGVTAAEEFICPTGGVFTHVDPNLFYLCPESNTKALTASCGFGKGFLQNDKVTGCLPFEDWECTEKMGVMPPKCDKYYTEFPNLNPNMYWKCENDKGENAKLIVCPDGQGYTRTYGCVDWKHWSCSDRA